MCAADSSRSMRWIVGHGLTAGSSARSPNCEEARRQGKRVAKTEPVALESLSGQPTRESRGCEGLLRKDGWVFPLKSSFKRRDCFDFLPTEMSMTAPITTELTAASGSSEALAAAATEAEAA